MNTLLACEGARKQFGGIRALEDVTFDLSRGEIVGLIGPNGAGKSTLIGILSGFIKPTAGRILFEGQDISSWPPYRVARAGIRRTFQAGNAFASLSIRNNIAIGAVGGRADAGIDDEVDHLLVQLRLPGLQKPSILSAGQLRLLAVARAIIGRPRLLLLDEPTAGLSTPEVDALSSILAHVLKRGTTILVVEHNMDFVFSQCQRVIVLDQGQVIATGTPAQIRKDQRVIQAYLGQPWEGDVA